MFALQFAKAMIAASSSDEKLERLKALGADHAIAAVTIGGHISLIDIFTGLGGDVPTFALMAEQARLQGLIVGSRRHQQEIVRAVEATGMRPTLDRSFGLGDLAAAFRRQESNAHLGKIVLEF